MPKNFCISGSVFLLNIYGAGIQKLTCKFGIFDNIP
jgi:hypothetical protein